MPVTYVKASEEIAGRVNRVMEKYHGELVQQGVKIDVLLASNETGEAVKVHGVRCYAAVRRLGLKDRAAGRGDAEIIIDIDRWGKVPDASRDAIIDHELEHLEYTGKRDDLDRPKLAMRPHDFDFGWFSSVAQRHGLASMEQLQAKRVVDEHGQTFFPFIRAADLPGLRMAQ